MIDLDQARAAETAAKLEQLDLAYDAQVRVVKSMHIRMMHLENCLRDTMDVIADQADDTLWYSDIETMVDRIESVLRGEYHDRRSQDGRREED